MTGSSKDDLRAFVAQHLAAAAAEMAPAAAAV